MINKGIMVRIEPVLLARLQRLVAANPSRSIQEFIRAAVVATIDQMESKYLYSPSDEAEDKLS